MGKRKRNNNSRVKTREKTLVIRYNNHYYTYPLKGNSITLVKRGDTLNIKKLGRMQVTRATLNIVQCKMLDPSIAWQWYDDYEDWE